MERAEVREKAAMTALARTLPAVVQAKAAANAAYRAATGGVQIVRGGKGDGVEELEYGRHMVTSPAGNSGGKGGGAADSVVGTVVSATPKGAVADSVVGTLASATPKGAVDIESSEDEWAKKWACRRRFTSVARTS